MINSIMSVSIDNLLFVPPGKLSKITDRRNILKGEQLF